MNVCNLVTFLSGKGWPATLLHWEQVIRPKSNTWKMNEENASIEREDACTQERATQAGKSASEFRPKQTKA